MILTFLEHEKIVDSHPDILSMAADALFSADSPVGSHDVVFKINNQASKYSIFVHVYTIIALNYLWPNAPRKLRDITDLRDWKQFVISGYGTLLLMTLWREANPPGTDYHPDILKILKSILVIEEISLSELRET